MSMNNLAKLLYHKGDDASAEALFRRALAGLARISCSTGREHPRLRRCIDDYVACLRATGKSQEQVCAALREVAPEYSAPSQIGQPSAIELNRHALELRKAGHLPDAESLLRQALELDEKTLGTTHPKIPHRLMNLSTVLIMQGKLDEARLRLTHAWQLKYGRHDLTSGRLLFVRVALALLELQPTKVFVGQLKTLLMQESVPDHADVARTWDIVCLIESLRPKLPPAGADFLEALADVLNDRKGLPRLDQFPLWQDCNPQPLD